MRVDRHHLEPDHVVDALLDLGAGTIFLRRATSLDRGNTGQGG
jgi:hypothetical protein